MRNILESRVFKFLAVFAGSFAIRLLPYRPPNVEPVLTSMMPFGKRYGAVWGFLYGFLSIVLYDAALNAFGSWTWINATAYGLLGIAARFTLKGRGLYLSNLIFAIIGTISFDVFTTFISGPLMFGSPVREAFIGQIPFTINHLLGNIILSLALTPLLERWIMQEKKIAESGSLKRKTA